MGLIKTKEYRISVRVTENMFERIEKLQDILCNKYYGIASITDVVEQSIALMYDLLVKCADGLSIKTKNGYLDLAVIQITAANCETND